MEHHSVQRRAVIFFAKNFFRPVFVKKAELFEIFRNRIDIPHCPLRFLKLTLIFYKRICKIRLPIDQLHWQRLNCSGSKISAVEYFSPASFRRKEVETRIFSESKCYSDAFAASQYWLWVGISSVICIYLVGKKVLTLPQNFSRKFFERREFSALSKVQRASR